MPVAQQKNKSREHKLRQSDDRPPQIGAYERLPNGKLRPIDPNDPNPPKRVRKAKPRQKGAAGEREAAKLLMEWLRDIYIEANVEPEVIERNLSQSRAGGHDLDGLPWCNIEVKRQEKLQLGDWWRQTLNQTKPGNIPLLMWRQNRQPWRFRTWATMQIGPVTHQAVVDLDEPNARLWLRAQVQTRLLARLRGLEREWGLTNPYQDPTLPTSHQP